MRKIYLDNTLKGFPADENVLRAIDEQREAIRQICLSMFGNSTVILSGLHLTTVGHGANITSELSGGYVWLDGEVLAVSGETWGYKVNPEHLWLGKGGEEIKAIYESGEELPAYFSEHGYVVANSNPGMTAGFLKSYTLAKRLGEAKLMVPDELTNLTGSIRVVSELSGVSLCGEINMYEAQMGDWVAVGTLPATDIATVFGAREATYPVLVKRQNESGETLPPIFNGNGYLRIKGNGEMLLYVARLEGGIDGVRYNGEKVDRAIIHINILHKP